MQDLKNIDNIKPYFILKNLDEFKNVNLISIKEYESYIQDHKYYGKLYIPGHLVYNNQVITNSSIYFKTYFLIADHLLYSCLDILKMNSNFKVLIKEE